MKLIFQKWRQWSDYRGTKWRQTCAQISLKINKCCYDSSCSDSSSGCQLPSSGRPLPADQHLRTKAVTLSMTLAWQRRAHFNNTPVKPPCSTCRLLWMDICAAAGRCARSACSRGISSSIGADIMVSSYLEHINVWQPHIQWYYCWNHKQVICPP